MFSTDQVFMCHKARLMVLYLGILVRNEKPSYGVILIN